MVKPELIMNKLKRYQPLLEDIDANLKRIKDKGYTEVTTIGKKLVIYNPIKNEYWPLTKKDFKKYKKNLEKFFKMDPDL
jgi:hypothetical protein